MAGKGQAKTGGRLKGVRNKATVELQAAAKRYSKDALKTLHAIARTGESESARVSAACALLDRAYGKPVQPIAADAEGPPLAAAITVIIAGGGDKADDASA